MSGNFRKNTSNFFVTFLIGLIVISFMFTGYESMKGAPGSIASVGDYSIKDREYDNEYRRQINFYKNALFQGKELTAQDIKRFALQNLVQSKTKLIFADKADIYVSPANIKKTVKNFEFFQSGGQFDINRYKGLLARNSMSPTDFEDDMKHDIKNRHAEVLMSNIPLSSSYLGDIRRFKAQRYFAHIIEINKNALKPSLSVSKKEIREFLKEPANKVRVESLFKQRKPSLDKEEQVQASHILIKGQDEAAKKKIEALAKKTNTRNFKSMANKNTQDPSGKGNGGSLGSFARGRMVPEFDQVAFTQKAGTISKPVKTSFGYHLIYVEKKIPGKTALFSNHQNKITTELVRDSKSKELDVLYNKVKNEALTALKGTNFKKIDALKKKYKISYDKNIEMNRFDGSKGTITMEKDQMQKVYSSMRSEDRATLDLSKDNKAHLISYRLNMNKDLPPFDMKKEKSGLASALSSKLKQDILKAIGDTIKVKQYVQL
jgi:peptidyl-prolyl cis-trans isomerase D